MNEIERLVYLYYGKSSRICRKNRYYVTIEKQYIQAYNNKLQHNYDVTNFKSKYSN